MANALKTLAQRLDYVRIQCEYPDWAAMARDLGVTAQAVGNWRKRQAIGKDGRATLRERTGVSVEWLESGVGVPFPGEIKLYAGPVTGASATAIARNSDRIDQLRGTVMALLDAVSATRPELAGAILERLDDLVHGDLTRLPFHANVRKLLAERAVAAPQHPPKSATPGSARHKHAS